MEENLSELKVTELKHQANEIRKSIINSLVSAGSGHTAGPLGMADVFTLLYFHAMKHDPKKLLDIREKYHLQRIELLV
jgi:transketolase